MLQVALRLTAVIVVLVAGCEPSVVTQRSDGRHGVPLPPNVGPWVPDYRGRLAASIAQRLTEKMAIYHRDHGTFPTSTEFWESLGALPIHNPVNGSSAVVTSHINLDSTKVGWVLNENDGTVLAGGMQSGAE